MAQGGAERKSKQSSRKSQRADTDTVSADATTSHRGGARRSSRKSPDGRGSSSKTAEKPNRSLRHRSGAVEQTAAGYKAGAQHQKPAGGTRSLEKPAAADKKPRKGSRKAHIAVEEVANSHDSGQDLGPWSHKDASKEHAGEGFEIGAWRPAEVKVDLVQVSETLQSLRMPSRCARGSQGGSLDSVAMPGFCRSGSTKIPSPPPLSRRPRQYCPEDYADQSPDRDRQSQLLGSNWPQGPESPANRKEQGSPSRIPKWMPKYNPIFSPDSPIVSEPVSRAPLRQDPYSTLLDMAGSSGLNPAKKGSPPGGGGGYGVIGQRSKGHPRQTPFQPLPLGSTRLRELRAVHDQSDTLMAQHLQALEARCGTAKLPLLPREASISISRSVQREQPALHPASAHSAAHQPMAAVFERSPGALQHVQATQTSASFTGVAAEGPWISRLSQIPRTTQTTASLLGDAQPRQGTAQQPQATQTPELVLAWSAEGAAGSTEDAGDVMRGAEQLLRPIAISAEAGFSAPPELQEPGFAGKLHSKSITGHSALGAACAQSSSRHWDTDEARDTPGDAGTRRESADSGSRTPAEPADALESIRVWYADADNPDNPDTARLSLRQPGWSAGGITSQSPAVSRAGSGGLLPWDRDDGSARQLSVKGGPELPEPLTADTAAWYLAQSAVGDSSSQQQLDGSVSAEPLTADLAALYLARTAADEQKPEPLTIDLAARYLAETAAVSSRSQGKLQEPEQPTLAVNVASVEPEAERKERRRSRKAAKAAVRAMPAEDSAQGQLSGWETGPASRLERVSIESMFATSPTRIPKPRSRQAGSQGDDKDRTGASERLASTKFRRQGSSEGASSGRPASRRASSASREYKASSPDQHKKVLAFMRRKRAEVTEQLRLEAEAAKAPVERRLAARRTAASIEIEQARMNREAAAAKAASPAKGLMHSQAAGTESLQILLGRSHARSRKSIAAAAPRSTAKQRRTVAPSEPAAPFSHPVSPIPTCYEGGTTHRNFHESASIDDQVFGSRQHSPNRAVHIERPLTSSPTVAKAGGSGSGNKQRGGNVGASPGALSFTFGATASASYWDPQQMPSEPSAKPPWDSSYASPREQAQEEGHAQDPGLLPSGSTVGLRPFEAAGGTPVQGEAGPGVSKLARMRWYDASASWLPEACIGPDSRHATSARSLRRLQWDRAPDLRSQGGSGGGSGGDGDRAAPGRAVNRLLQAARLMQSAQQKRKLPRGVPSVSKSHRPSEPRTISPSRAAKGRSTSHAEDELGPVAPMSPGSGVAGAWISGGTTAQGERRRRRADRLAGCGGKTATEVVRSVTGTTRSLAPQLPTLALDAITQSFTELSTHRSRTGSSRPSSAGSVAPRLSDPGGNELVSSRRSTARLWSVDPRTSHIASVNRMMAQALELQDKVAALAVTAPVTSSPRAVPAKGPASLAAAFQLDLRTPRLMMTRSLPTSFDAILAQYELTSRRSPRPSPRQLEVHAPRLAAAPTMADTTLELHDNLLSLGTSLQPDDPAREPSSTSRDSGEVLSRETVQLTATLPAATSLEPLGTQAVPELESGPAAISAPEAGHAASVTLASQSLAEPAAGSAGIQLQPVMCEIGIQTSPPESPGLALSTSVPELSELDTAISLHDGGNASSTTAGATVEVQQRGPIARADRLPSFSLEEAEATGSTLSIECPAPEAVLAVEEEAPHFAAWGTAEELDVQLDESLELAMLQLVEAAKELSDWRQPDCELLESAALDPEAALLLEDDGAGVEEAGHRGSETSKRGTAESSETSATAEYTEPGTIQTAERLESVAAAAEEDMDESSEELLQEDRAELPLQGQEQIAVQPEEAALCNSTDPYFQVPGSLAETEVAGKLVEPDQLDSAAALEICEQAYHRDLERVSEPDLVADLGHLTARSFFSEPSCPLQQLQGATSQESASQAEAATSIVEAESADSISAEALSEDEQPDRMLVEDLRTNSATKRKQPLAEDAREQVHHEPDTSPRGTTAAISRQPSPTTPMPTDATPRAKLQRLTGSFAEDRSGLPGLGSASESLTIAQEASAAPEAGSEQSHQREAGSIDPAFSTAQEVSNAVQSQSAESLSPAGVQPVNGGNAGVDEEEVDEPVLHTSEAVELALPSAASGGSWQPAGEAHSTKPSVDELGDGLQGNAQAAFIRFGDFGAEEWPAAEDSCATKGQDQEEILSASAPEQAAEQSDLIPETVPSAQLASTTVCDVDEASTAPPSLQNATALAVPVVADAAGGPEQQYPEATALQEEDAMAFRWVQPGLVTAISHALELSEESTFRIPGDMDALALDTSAPLLNNFSLATAVSLVLSEESASGILELSDTAPGCFAGSAVSSPEDTTASKALPSGRDVPEALAPPDGVGSDPFGEPGGASTALAEITAEHREGNAAGLLSHTRSSVSKWDEEEDVIAAQSTAMDSVPGSGSSLPRMVAQSPADYEYDGIHGEEGAEPADPEGATGAAEPDTLAEMPFSSTGPLDDGDGALEGSTEAAMRPTASTLEYESASESGMEGWQDPDVVDAELGPLEVRAHAAQMEEGPGLSASSLAAFAVMRPTATTADYDTASEGELEGWEAPAPAADAADEQPGTLRADRLNDRLADLYGSTASEDEVGSSGREYSVCQSPDASSSATSDRIAAGLLSQLIDEAILDINSTPAEPHCTDQQDFEGAAMLVEASGEKEGAAPGMVAPRAAVEGRSPELELLSTELYEWRHSSESESDRSAVEGKLLLQASPVKEPASLPHLTSATSPPQRAADTPRGVAAPKMVRDDPVLDEEGEPGPGAVVKEQAYISAYIARTLDAYFELAPRELMPDEAPLSLETFVALERALPESEDAQHIHNKALFDAVGLALVELLPPYPQKPMPPQRRVWRASISGAVRRQEVLRREVERRVMGWCAARGEDCVDAMLREDILEDEVEWADVSAEENAWGQELVDGIWEDLLQDTCAALL